MDEITTCGVTSSNAVAAPPDAVPAAPTPEPRATHHRRRGVVLLCAGALVVALALVAWLAFVHATPPAFVATSVDRGDAQDGSGDAPDILHATGWLPLIPAPGTFTDAQLTGVGQSSIVVMTMTNDDGGLAYAGFDLTAGRAVWGPIPLADVTSMHADWIGVDTSDDGLAVLEAGGDSTVYSQIDPATGAVLLQWSQAPSDGEFFSGDFFASYNYTSDAYHMTVRDKADLTHVVWQGEVSDPHLLDGHWVPTMSGVVDVTTGQPAPFGADSGISPSEGRVSYIGDDDDMMRVVKRHDDTFSFEAWDAGGNVSRWSAPAACDSASWNADMVASLAKGGTLEARRYSDGKPLWTKHLTAPDSTGWSMWLLHGDIVIVRSDGSPGVTYGFTSTGKPLLDGAPIGDSSFASSRVLYLQDVTDGSLTAYNYRSPALPGLWSVPAPAPDVSYTSVGGHVVAYTPAGQLWLLQGS